MTVLPNMNRLVISKSRDSGKQLFTSVDNRRLLAPDAWQAPKSKRMACGEPSVLTFAEAGPREVGSAAAILPANKFPRDANRIAGIALRQSNERWSRGPPFP